MSLDFLAKISCSFDEFAFVRFSTEGRMNLRIEVFSYVQNYCLADLLFSCHWVSLVQMIAPVYGAYIRLTSSICCLHNEFATAHNELAETM